MIRIVTTKGASVIPPGVKKIVLGKQLDDTGDEVLKLKWSNTKDLNEQLLGIQEVDDTVWQITALGNNPVFVRGDLLVRTTAIALADVNRLKETGDLVEVPGLIKFKLAYGEPAPKSTSQEPDQ